VVPTWALTRVPAVGGGSKGKDNPPFSETVRVNPQKRRTFALSWGGKGGGTVRRPPIGQKSSREGGGKGSHTSDRQSRSN